MGMLRSLLLRGSQNPWLARQATRRRFARRAVSRFMPGEDLDSALRAAGELREAGIATVLTCLGENVNQRDQARSVTIHYLDVLAQIERRALPCHLSIKLTQLGLDLGQDACEEELSRLLARAAECGNFVWIDMEGSAYTDVTLQIYRRARAGRPNVGLCLQAYLYRTAADLESLLPLSARIRLVKGAYREPAEIAFPRKHDVDGNFLALTKRLLAPDALRNGGAPGIATHDPALIAAVERLGAVAGLPKGAYEFQMLYGIRRSDQRRLAAAGHRVRVLISYGSAWFPWYMRRLAERPANLWFLARSLLAG